MHLSTRAASIGSSPALELAAKVAALRASGVDVVSLSIGEPDFPSPPEAIAAATSFVAKGHVGYTAGSGRPDLRAAGAAFIARECGVTRPPAEIVVTNGAKEGLSCALLALVGPGDEVACPTPAWMSYDPMCRIAGARFVGVPCDPRRGFVPDAGALAAALTPRTRVLLLNSPNNPTGAVYGADALAAIADVLASRPEVTVVSDEIYSPFAYGQPHVSIATQQGMAERTVIVHGMSKGYAMTGWRIGFVAAPRNVADAVGALKSQFSSSACAVSQEAAVAALAAGDGWARRMRAAYLERRRQALELLAAMPGITLDSEPAGAFYLFPRVDAFFGPDLPDSESFCTRLLDEQRLAIVPGGAFGEDRCVRISYAADEPTLREAMARLGRFLDGRRKARSAQGAAKR